MSDAEYAIDLSSHVPPIGISRYVTIAVELETSEIVIIDGDLFKETRYADFAPRVSGHKYMVLGTILLKGGNPHISKISIYR